MNYESAPWELVAQHRYARMRSSTCPECRCSTSSHAPGCPEREDPIEDDETDEVET